MFYNYLARDSKIILGSDALEVFNMFCSPSALLSKKTMYAKDGIDFLNKLEFLHSHVYVDKTCWFPYHIITKDFHIPFGSFCSEMVDLETGDRASTPLIELKDFKKEIEIWYFITRTDGVKHNSKVILPKKSLTSFIEVLKLSSDLTKSFDLYISKESLKNEYRTT